MQAASDEDVPVDKQKQEEVRRRTTTTTTFTFIERDARVDKGLFGVGLSYYYYKLGDVSTQDKIVLSP